MLIDLKHIKALLIDMDGTLVDSIPLLYSVYSEFLHKFGHEGSREEFDELVGPKLSEVMETLNSRYQLGKDPEQLFAEYQELLYQHYTQNLKLFVGARTFLRYAKELGLKLALVTSASERLAKGFLQAEGIENTFDVIITAEGVDKGKPHPDIYQKALFALSIMPDQAIAIEDSANGIQASTGAGIYTLYLTHHQEPFVEDQSLVTKVNDWTAIHDLFKVVYG